MAQARARAGRRIIGLVVLALGLAYLEASVVVYLREAMAPSREGHFPKAVREPLPLIPFEQLRRTDPQTASLVGFEIAREVAAIAVLLAAAYGFRRRRGELVGMFLLAFAVWDIFYYVFLKILVGWPASLSTWDVLFLIPVPWVAPVWAPLAVSGTLLVMGLLLLRRRAGPISSKRALGGGVLVVAGAGLILASFFLRLHEAMRSVPRQFDWPLFLAGWLLGVAGVAWLLSRTSALRR